MEINKVESQSEIIEYSITEAPWYFGVYLNMR